MSSFDELLAANRRRHGEWGNGTCDLSYRGNELAGEVGEACNVLKKLERARLGLVGSRATVDELADELADVVICVGLIAMDTGIDMEAAWRRKFNATSRKYGLKTQVTE